MINNNEDITLYTNTNKIYIPSSYRNSQWSYRFNGDYVIIITNQNCNQQYNTTYCNCYSYNYKNNVISNTYQCSTNSNNAEIPFNSTTDDINYSQYIRQVFIQDKGLYLGIIILGILFAVFLTRERKSL